MKPSEFCLMMVVAELVQIMYKQLWNSDIGSNTMKRLGCGMILAGFLLSSQVAIAADATGDPRNICIPLQPAQILAIENNADLTNEVVNLMNEAVSVADDPSVIQSSRPAFTWANEAKIACGKAYGYLQSDHRDEQYINKCECFSERMQAYLR